MAPREPALTDATDGDRARAVFCRVLELPVAEREAKARRLCADDQAALAEVLLLLGHAEVATDRLRPVQKDRPRHTRLETNRVLGRRWRVGRLLGAGANGSVYEAADVETGRTAALKIVYGLHEDRVAAARREIALLRWLRLPGVVQLIDDGTVDDAVYCVMEKIDGRRFPGRVVPAPWAQIEGAALGLLEAVARVHAAGVVHCDLKPANVLVDERGAITIVDLGISSETRSRFTRRRVGGARGTPAYEAPEQRRGGVPHTAWDLYSVGVVLFEALTGRLPEPGNVREIAALPAPPRVRRVLRSLLAPRRADRARSALSALRALRPRPPRRARRTRWTDAELRARFAGPDLLLHLREDAAAEILRRTGGRPREVEEEIGAWIRAGLAREEAGLVIVARPALERLRAESGEDAADRAFESALRKGAARDVGRAALAVAARRMAQGRPSAALAALFEGASAARAARDPRLELRVMRTAALAAVRTSSSVELDRALLLLQRATVGAQAVADLEIVVRAALHFFAGRPRDALDEIVPVCERSRDADTLRIAWSVRSGVAQSLGLSEERRVVRLLRAWLRTSRVRGAASILATTSGWLRYHEGRFALAMGLHLRAAHAATDPAAQARCLTDAATAGIECEPLVAREIAQRARRLSARLRMPVHEGRAVQCGRVALVRSASNLGPDLGLVAAASQIGLPHLSAGVALTEAVLAWRVGEVDTARDLALQASRSWGAAPAGAAALALAAVVGEPVDTTAFTRGLNAAQRELPPPVGMQVLALLALARPRSKPSLRAAFARLRLARHDRDRGRTREFMSIEAAEKILFD